VEASRVGLNEIVGEWWAEDQIEREENRFGEGIKDNRGDDHERYAAV
jgi:hypothetical protein